MNVGKSGTDLFNTIQEQIVAAEKKGQPINTLVKQQIELLKDSHDEFVKMAKKEGYDMKNPKVGEIEIRQYVAMKQLAQKIGLPIEEYDKKIKDITIRIFGEANYKRFFEDQ